MLRTWQINKSMRTQFFFLKKVCSLRSIRMSLPPLVGFWCRSCSFCMKFSEPLARQIYLFWVGLDILRAHLRKLLTWFPLLQNPGTTGNILCWITLSLNPKTDTHILCFYPSYLLMHHLQQCYFWELPYSSTIPCIQARNSKAGQNERTSVFQMLSFRKTTKGGSYIVSGIKIMILTILHTLITS